ncbi:MAG: hypothetical protein ABI862_14320 [Ilumatobacteraceae bacterium]
MKLSEIEEELETMIGPRMWKLALDVAYECCWGGDLTIVERENEPGVADQAIAFHAAGYATAEECAEVLLGSARFYLFGERR